MKSPELIENADHGFDLMVEKDWNCPVRIMTGEHSLQFFTELKVLCEEAIERMKVKPNYVKLFKGE